ncbi:MAG: sensor histidine kinase, partial [Chloroflexota bacterium]
SAEKEDLLAVIAHELATPTTAAKGFIEMAERRISEGKSESLGGYLTFARQAIDRLSRLTADLAEAARGMTPRLRMVETELGPLVEQACSWVSASAASKGLGLSCEHPPQPVRIIANCDALLTIFGNLIANAVRYTPSGGEVSVRYFSAEQAVVEFRDTGIGIDEEQVERIFEKFYRAPAARHLDAHGLGLGLSLVRHLVAAHGGVMEVESKPGSGSVFRVTLPLDATQPRETEEEHG